MCDQARVHGRYAQCSENAHPFSADVQNLHVTKRTFRATLFMQQGSQRHFKAFMHPSREEAAKQRFGWFFFAFLFGGLCAQWRIGRAPAAMRRRFMRVDSFQGLSYADILFLARRSPDRVIVRPNGSDHPHLASPRLPSRAPFLSPRRMSRGGGGVGGGCG